MTVKTIAVGALARVEGEGGLKVTVKDGRVEEVQFNIFEPPRLYEAFLRGRSYAEAPDITSRICGICPIAYQTSAIAAIENALGLRPSEEVRALRRLIFCGEWIESHTLHVCLLHAPDFLGRDSALEMARDKPREVERGLRLKKIGNHLMTILGGREIHPVNLRIGGFYRAPRRDELRAAEEDLEWAVGAAEETVRWVAGFEFPDCERDHEFVSLRPANGDYPIEEGTLVSSQGLSADVADFETVIVEEQVPWSTALQSTLQGRSGYVMGPLARTNLNFDRLTPRVRDAARAAGFAPPCRNPYRSIIARALEILYACEEALRLIDSYVPPEPPFAQPEPRASTGSGAVEAPRGTLFQRYRLDAAGLIEDARIVPPTAQNQKAIEQDVRRLVEEHLSLPQKQLSLKCEHAVRNYDPCISCATHVIRIER